MVIGAFTVLEMALIISLSYALYKLKKADGKLQKALLAKLCAFTLTSVVLELAFPGYLVMQAIGYFTNVHYGNDHAQHAQSEIGQIGYHWEVTLPQVVCLPISCAAGLILSLLRITDLSHLHLPAKIDRGNTQEIRGKDEVVPQEGSLNDVGDDETIRFAYGELSGEVRNAVRGMAVPENHTFNGPFDF